MIRSLVYIFLIFNFVKSQTFLKRNLVSCVGGYYLDELTFKCLPCKAGKYSPDGYNYCLPCEEGTYSFAGNSSCIYCPKGTY